MKTKVFKRIAIAMFLILFALSFFNNAKALTLSNMDTMAKEFIEQGSGVAINTQNVTKEFKELGQILTMIGVGVMVGVTTYMGIKYLTAGPEAQAKLKTQLIGVVVSGVVIFGAYGIWSIVIQIAETF